MGSVPGHCNKASLAITGVILYVGGGFYHQFVKSATSVKCNKRECNKQGMPVNSDLHNFIGENFTTMATNFFPSIRKAMDLNFLLSSNSVANCGDSHKLLKQREFYYKDIGIVCGIHG